LHVQPSTCKPNWRRLQQAATWELTYCGQLVCARVGGTTASFGLPNLANIQNAVDGIAADGNAIVQHAQTYNAHQRALSTELSLCTNFDVARVNQQLAGIQTSITARVGLQLWSAGKGGGRLGRPSAALWWPLAAPLLADSRLHTWQRWRRSSRGHTSQVGSAPTSSGFLSIIVWNKIIHMDYRWKACCDVRDMGDLGGVRRIAVLFRRTI
jgi:hypothetical protein